jgi:hypothetical protein
MVLGVCIVRVQERGGGGTPTVHVCSTKAFGGASDFSEPMLVCYMTLAPTSWFFEHQHWPSQHVMMFPLYVCRCACA